MGERIRLATPLDAWRLSVPPVESLRLDLAQQLLAPHQPLQGFLANWLGLRQGLYTLLAWGPSGLLACAQAQARDMRWEVRYLAVWKPALPETEALWQELLLALGQEAARRQAARLLARLPAEEYLRPFQEAGFSPFAEEMILLWDGTLPPRPGPALGLQPVQPEHLWAVQQLRAGLTPPIVQHAEGDNSGARTPGPGGEGWVWPVEEGVRAYLERRRGRQGTALEVLLDPAWRQHATEILAHGLAGCSPPVYLVLRSYQGELRETARRLGFRPLAEQLLLVKHLAVRAEQRQPAAARLVERHLRAAPSAPAVGRTLASVDGPVEADPVPAQATFASGE